MRSVLLAGMLVAGCSGAAGSGTATSSTTRVTLREAHQLMIQDELERMTPKAGEARVICPRKVPTKVGATFECGFAFQTSVGSVKVTIKDKRGNFNLKIIESRLRKDVLEAAATKLLAESDIAASHVRCPDDVKFGKRTQAFSCTYEARSLRYEIDGKLDGVQINLVGKPRKLAESSSFATW